MSDEIRIDPRIQLKLIPDGEIHLEFTFSLDDIANYARAYIAITDGKITETDVVAVMRLKGKIGIDGMIAELQRMRKELYG